MSSTGEITHVSDTALMVAACRAHETELEDAFVRDPFAARLAGERGLAILRGLPHSAVVRFGLAIRTRFVDELLLEALRTHPITTVLSVGLDRSRNAVSMRRSGRSLRTSSTSAVIVALDRGSRLP